MRKRFAFAPEINNESIMTMTVPYLTEQRCAHAPQGLPRRGAAVHVHWFSGFI